MPPRDLEPPPGQDSDWDELYVARGTEVPAHRPIYTGDVFLGVPLRPTRGEVKTRAVMVIQHPCAMRPDGIHLSPSILVARVHPFPVLARTRWNTSGKLMPLPDLVRDIQSTKANQAAFFDDTYHIHPADLILENRIACLSEIGTYLLLQRWVYHSSRVVVPTWQYEDMNSHVFAEADILESWCEPAIETGVLLVDAVSDAAAWLDEEVGGTTRRQMLRNSALRSSLIRDAKKQTTARYGPSAPVISLQPSGTDQP
jgi:hypothetical protein